MLKVRKERYMSRPTALAVLLLVTLHTIARAQTPPPAPSPAPTYHDLLARLKARDTLVDFTALRVAYAASPDYAPYGSGADDHRAALRVALGKRDYQRALQEADATLGIDYLDVRTHVVRAYVAEQLGDTAAALWDRIVAARLVRSIMQSGAGTVDSPYVVISVAEEYAVLGMNDYERGMQSLSECGTRPCDILEATQRQTHEKRTFYFDISLPKAYMDRLFQGKP